MRKTVKQVTDRDSETSQIFLYFLIEKVKLRWPPEHTEKLPIALELAPETNKISRAIQVGVLT